MPRQRFNFKASVGRAKTLHRQCYLTGISSGRPSKHLNDIFCDARLETPVKAAAHEGIGFEAGLRCDDVFDANKVENGKLGIWRNIQKYVEFAVLAEVATRTRPEQGKMNHAFALQSLARRHDFCRYLFFFQESNIGQSCFNFHMPGCVAAGQPTHQPS